MTTALLCLLHDSTSSAATVVLLQSRSTLARGVAYQLLHVDRQVVPTGKHTGDDLLRHGLGDLLQGR